MSRFGNLEFGESEDQSSDFQKPLLKDEAFYLKEALTAFQTGNFEPGLRFYAKVLEYNAANVTAWTGQVRMLIELGEYREAKLWADKALERFPHQPELLAAKAVARTRRKGSNSSKPRRSKTRPAQPPIRKHAGRALKDAAIR